MKIATIEQAINDFVVTSITMTNTYHIKHKKNIKAAISVYHSDIEPKIHTAAVDLCDKLIAVRQTIVSLEGKQNKDELVAQSKISQANKDRINIDAELAVLNQTQTLPIPAFKEFHTLEFSNEQNRIAATNIVKKSLATLIEAKLNTNNDNDLQKLDNQISKVKSFVRSIASNTEESQFRKAKHLKIEKENPLYLSGGKKAINDIDNTIAVNNRYLDSYDNTLPLSDD